MVSILFKRTHALGMRIVHVLSPLLQVIFAMPAPPVMARSLWPWASTDPDWIENNNTISVVIEEDWGRLTKCVRTHSACNSLPSSSFSTAKNTLYHRCRQPQYCCPFDEAGIRTTIPAGYMHVGALPGGRYSTSLSLQEMLNTFDPGTFRSCRCRPVKVQRMFVARSEPDLNTANPGELVWRLDWKRVVAGYHCRRHTDECRTYEC